MQKYLFSKFIILLVLLWIVSDAEAQTVARPWVNRYLNFGKENYRDPPFLGGNAKNNYEIARYNVFGEFLLRGFHLFTWDELRAQPPFMGSIIFKDKRYMTFHRLILARDSYKNWSSRIMLGDILEATFTPLTFDLAMFTGLRWDLIYRRDQRFSLICTRPSNPVFIKAASSTGPERSYIPSYGGLLLLGGHWEGRFLRDHIRLGATFVNMHRFNSLVRQEDFWHGVVPPKMVPDTVIVYFSDDSPEDGVGGAAVFDVQPRVEIELGGGHRKIITDIEPVVIPRNGAKWVGAHWEANGDAVVEYHFPMPQNAVDVEFSVLVGNDYRIKVGQAHEYVEPGGKSVINRTLGYVVKRAEGNVRDLSNRKRVTFHYGIPTAMNFYGFNFDIHLIGFKLRGEVAWNRNYFRYPISAHTGAISIMKDIAYYILGEKQFGKFNIGGEFFSIGPKYSSYNPYTLGFYFNKPDGPVCSGYPIRDPLTMGPPKDNTLRYAFVDDNDDNDRFPDQGSGDSAQRGQGKQSLEAGVYPGLDKDQDGVPDNNRNNNHIPDYLEPFLKYDSDPDDFYWGDDVNNNGVVDAFEDDLLPDYPYYKDERGVHSFLTFTPWQNLDLTYGYYDVHQVAGGRINQVSYLKVDYYREFPGKGEIELHHQTKRVKDDIKNFTYRYQVIPKPGSKAYESVPVEDELLMRNSWVNRGLLRVNLSPVQNFNISNTFRYELNKQLATQFRDGTSQPDGRVDFWGIASKIDYNYRYKKLTLMPKFKYLYFKKDRSNWAGSYAEYINWYPIFRTDYKFTERTLFQLGVQGFPFFKERFKDQVSPENNFYSTTYVFELVNHSISWGYKLVTSIGYQYTTVDYDDPQVKDTDFSKVFIRMVVGEEIIGSAQ